MRRRTILAGGKARPPARQVRLAAVRTDAAAAAGRDRDHRPRHRQTRSNAAARQRAVESARLLQQPVPPGSGTYRMTLSRLSSQAGRANKIYDAWLTAPIGALRSAFDHLRPRRVTGRGSKAHVDLKTVLSMPGIG